MDLGFGALYLCQQMATPTVENYLKALLALGKHGEPVGVSALSNYLQVSKPSASAMVQVLHSQGLVNYQRYKPLSLTEKGKTTAALVVRKHRLTEMFLVERMGFGWEEVHDIAEQMEHINSPLFFDRMDELLGYPTVDPHGSPIPSAEGVFADKQKFISLAEASVGLTYTLRAVAHDDDELLAYLTRKGIALGTTFKVETIEPFDGSIAVRYKEKSTPEWLSKAVCACLLVE